MNLRNFTAPTGTQADDLNSLALTSCQRARDLEECGEYYEAVEAMENFWQGIGVGPNLSGLSREAAADVRLRVGVLTGWVGSTEQIGGLQETAKDFISQSQEEYEALGNREKVIEAQTELAYCYWRAGGLDEARIILEDALKKLGDEPNDLRARVVLRAAIMERLASNLDAALQLLMNSAALFETSESDALKGKFHVNLADVLNDLRKNSTEPEEMTDRAILEYAAASYHFERAGHKRYRAAVENNLSIILFELGRFDEAHEHLGSARKLFVALKDKVHTAEVDETRSRVFFSQGRFPEAERAAREAVSTLETGDAYALLAVSLIALGRAQARMGNDTEARLALSRGIEVGERIGAQTVIADAALTMLEELIDGLNYEEKLNLYVRADEHLISTPDQKLVERLRACARLILLTTKGDTDARLSLTLLEDPAHSIQIPQRVVWDGFKLGEVMCKVEESFIEQALIAAEGSVSKAARLLGMSHHESLRSKLKKEALTSLNSIRKPIKPRRKSIIKKRSA